MNRPAMYFTPPSQPFPGMNTTIRLGNKWALNLQPGDKFLVLDCQNNILGKARVVGIWEEWGRDVRRVDATRMGLEDIYGVDAVAKADGMTVINFEYIPDKGDDDE